MIETICFSPLRIPDAIKFNTPIAVSVVKFPPFRVHQQVKYPAGFLSVETICFNPLRIPDAIKFNTPIAVTVVKFPPFRVHQQVKYPAGFLTQVGGGGGTS